MHPLLETLPSLPPVHLSKFLQSLLPLTVARPHLFAPHLRPLLSFLASLLLSSPDVNDPGPTPTVGRPFPSGGAFEFPPASANAKGKAPVKAVTREEEEREDARKAALEFVISLSEARPAMVRKVEGWSGAIVRGCLEGMGELDDEETESWLEADVSTCSGSLSSPLTTTLSHRKIRRTTLTHTSTSKHWTALRARWVESTSYHRLSNTFRRCSLLTTGGTDMRDLWQLRLWVRGQPV